MTSVSSPAPAAGPVFVRLLARVAGAGAGLGDGPPLAATLARWIDWPRAVILAGALDGPVAAAAEHRFDTADDADCAQARTQLREAILADTTLSLPAAATPDADAGFASLRARHVAHQRAILAVTGRLRGRLRDRLAARPDGARLAEVDAAMEQALGAREHALLSTVPNLLGRHFERLQAQAAAASQDTTMPPPAGPWLDRFRLEMRGLLLAELDVRFSPVEALLAALRATDPTP
jgi:hypothetical protein